MEIFKILQRKSKFFYLFLILLGFTNALWSNALLLLINNKINGMPLPYFEKQSMVVFVSLVVASYLVSRFFQSFMLRLTNDLSYEMGILIFHKVRHAPYEGFMRFGREKIYSLLSDTETVSQFPGHFIEAFNSFVIFVVGLVPITFWL